MILTPYNHQTINKQVGLIRNPTILAVTLLVLYDFSAKNKNLGF